MMKRCASDVDIQLLRGYSRGPKLAARTAYLQRELPDCRNRVNGIEVYSSAAWLLVNEAEEANPLKRGVFPLCRKDSL